jgi:acyl-CoA thioesterase-1
VRILHLLAGIGVAVLLVVASGTAAYGIHKHNECAPNLANSAAGSGHAGPTTGPVVSVIGDSYASGFGLDNPRQSWAFGLARSDGLNTTVDAFPGTGYDVGGACGDRSFSTRIESINPDAAVVIIEGGLNDAIFDTSSDTLRHTGQQVLRAASQRATHARIVMVGPATPPAVPTSAVRRVDGILRSVASSQGAAYVDLTQLPFHSPDGTHPDAAGHRDIARAVSAAINAN